MAMAAKERHDSRVHLVASLPSLFHCSAVPRWLWKATMRSAGRARSVMTKPTRVQSSLECHSILTTTRRRFFQLCVITETGMVASRLTRRSPDGPLEQVSDLVLDIPVGRQPNRIPEALG